MSYKNFDEFLKEPEEISFEYKGRTWHVSGSVPMVKLFEIYEAEKMEEMEALEAVTKLLLADEYEEFKRTVHAPHALEIMQWLMEQVMGQMESEMEGGEEEAGKDLKTQLRSARQSTSPTGTNSKQTSGGITLSPVMTSAS